MRRVPLAHVRASTIHQRPTSAFSSTFPPRPENDLARSLDPKITLNERLAFATIRETTELIRSKSITPLDLVRESKERMAYLADYNFILSPASNKIACGSLESSKHVEEEGAVVFTYAMNDVTMRRKTVTTEGSLLPRQPARTPAEENSVLARALAQVGGICIGSTTSLPEFSHNADTFDPVVGQTRNPHNPDLTIGGSSGGSAGAVASGICHVAMAADSAGSVVGPASFSGTVGVKLPSKLVLKPLGPQVPDIRFGINSMSKGFFTRKVEDAAVVLDALSQRQHNFLAAALELESTAFAGKRVAYLPTFSHVQVDEQTASAVRNAVRALPKSLHVDQVDTLGFDDPGVTATTLWYRGYADLHAALEKKYRKELDWEQFLDKTTLEYVHRGQAISEEQAREAGTMKAKMGAQINDFFEGYDFLITPAMPCLPWPAGSTHPAGFDWDTAHHAAFSYPFNYSHNPCIVLPCGTTTGELYPLPIGLQIVGRMDSARPDHSVKELIRFSALCEMAFAYDHWPAFGALRYDYWPTGECCGQSQ